MFINLGTFSVFSSIYYNFYPDLKNCNKLWTNWQIFSTSKIKSYFLQLETYFERKTISLSENDMRDNNII